MVGFLYGKAERFISRTRILRREKLIMAKERSENFDGLSPAGPANNIIQAMETQIKHLKNNETVFENFDAFKKLHISSIENVQGFLREHKSYHEEEWYKKCFDTMVTFEGLLVERLIEYLDKALLEERWSKERSEEMQRNKNEILNFYLPDFKVYKYFKTVEDLKALALAIELKIKAGDK